MSSDFESLSCASERSRDPWNRNDDDERENARAQEAGSSDVDMMDDLVEAQDRRLLRQLAVRSSSTRRARQVAAATRPHATAALYSDDDDEEDAADAPEAAAYGYRDFGVTGVPPPPRRSAAVSRYPRHRAAQPPPPGARKDGAALPHSPDGTDEEDDEDGGRRAGAVATAARPRPSRGKVRLFTTADPAGSCGARCTADSLPAAGQLPTVPAPGRGVTALVEDAEAAEDAGGPVATHRPPTRTASGASTAAAEPPHRATCPPDSATITPVASAATITATTTTRGTNDGADSDDAAAAAEADVDSAADDGDDDAQDVRAPRVERGTRPVPSAAASALLLRPRRHPAARDADGFYNTGLLEEDSLDDGDDDEPAYVRGTTASRTAGGHVDVAAAAAASLFYMASGNRATARDGTAWVAPRSRGVQEGAAVDAATALATPLSATAAAGSGTTTMPAPPLPPSSRPAVTRRRAATDQLRRLAAALPAMTTVQWLSLLITLLVPVNLICIDVMALSWIRRRVDWGYAARGTGVTAAAVASARGQLCNGTTAAYAAGRRWAAASMHCGGVAGSSSTSTSTSRVDVTTTRASAAASSTSRTSAASVHDGHDAPAAAVAAAAAAAAHTVPALCSVFLWLLVPNGLLFRLVQRRLGRRADAAGGGGGSTGAKVAATSCGATGQVGDALAEEWAVCRELYARVRRLAPQLEVVELLVRYACLWLVVHAALPCAGVAEEWTEAWLLRTSSDPVCGDVDASGERGGTHATTTAATAIAGIQQCGSNWRAALDAAASANPRRAADAIVAV